MKVIILSIPSLLLVFITHAFLLFCSALENPIYKKYSVEHQMKEPQIEI